MEKNYRRCRLWMNTAAEMSIYNAMAEVEKIGADEKLTKAVMLLAEAKDLVADFIDEVNPDPDAERDVHYYKCSECGDVWLTHNKSPEWLIKQTNMGVHVRSDMQIPCRTGMFVEITKEEFNPLHEQMVKKSGGKK